MVYRFMFVGYTEDVNSVKIVSDSNCYVALSYKDKKVYMYVESNHEYVEPDLLVEGGLLQYPGGNRWERANEIFHYSKPIKDEQWRRKVGNKRPHIMVNKLKPEMVSRYIFYHYQYQEEVPGDGDRYGIIFLQGQDLIFYLEEPTENETERLKGELNTSHTPISQWQELMGEHFADCWRDSDVLEFSQYCGFNYEHGKSIINN